MSDDDSKPAGSTPYWQRLRRGWKAAIRSFHDSRVARNAVGCYAVHGNAIACPHCGSLTFHRTELLSIDHGLSTIVLMPEGKVIVKAVVCCGCGAVQLFAEK